VGECVDEGVNKKSDMAAAGKRRVHRDGNHSVGRNLALLANGFDRLDRRIAERMYIGGLEDELRLRRCWPDEIGCQRAKSGKHAEAKKGAAIHGVLLDSLLDCLFASRGGNGAIAGLRGGPVLW